MLTHTHTHTELSLHWAGRGEAHVSYPQLIVAKSMFSGHRLKMYRCNRSPCSHISRTLFRSWV